MKTALKTRMDWTLSHLNSFAVGMGLCVFLLVATGYCASQSRRLESIEYHRAGDERLLLDASIPPGEGLRPGVILIHGGGWSSGNRRDMDLSKRAFRCLPLAIDWRRHIAGRPASRMSRRRYDGSKKTAPLIKQIRSGLRLSAIRQAAIWQRLPRSLPSLPSGCRRSLPWRPRPITRPTTNAAAA